MRLRSALAHLLLTPATRACEHAFPSPQLQHAVLASAAPPALRPGPATERFPMVTDGLSYETPEITRLFYANSECLREAPSPPCPGPEYRYYEVRCRPLRIPPPAPSMQLDRCIVNGQAL